MDKAKPRWGIFTVAALMCLSNLFAGGKVAYYVFIWGRIAYIAFRGDLDQVALELKVLIVFNVVLAVPIFLLVGDSSDLWRWISGVETKNTVFFGFLISLAIKVGMLAYVNVQRKAAGRIKSAGALSGIAAAWPQDSDQMNMPIQKPNIAQEDAWNGGIPAQPFPLKAPSRSSISDPATATNVEEEFWARALDECDGPSRRRGLWARVFSEAQGNEAIAKANYLKHRAAELRVDDQENRLRINEQEQRSAYDLLPKGRCPKCAAVIPLASKECPECKESFTAYEGWAVIPIADSDADRSTKPEVNADTLAPTVGEKAASANKPECSASRPMGQLFYILVGILLVFLVLVSMLA